ncbi:MAG: fumarylacetoacetate hydrolase family protein [Sneathiellaceae bacterium]
MSGLTRSEVEEAAARLRAASAGNAPVPPLRSGFPALDEAGAYAVQAENLDHALRQAGRIAGRRIDLVPPPAEAAVQQAPAAGAAPGCGTILADAVYGDGEEIPWTRLSQPRATAQIALVLERALPMADATIADIVRATAFALPAIDIADSRIAGWDIDRLDSIADNACAGMLVLGGTKNMLAGLDLRLCGMTLGRRGETIASGAGAASLGHPLNAAVWLSRRLAALGQPLMAGDLILTGALAPRVPVRPGDVLECRIGGLGPVRAVLAQAAPA